MHGIPSIIDFSEFIQHQAIKLAEALPSVEVVIQARKDRFPHLEAEYSIALS